MRAESVRGNEIRLAQPLPLQARLAFDPQLTTFAPAIVGAGVEGLTIRMRKTAPAQPAPGATAAARAALTWAGAVEAR
ncbi:hypothetical protein [Saccharothrix deserti]|uniref:hypothetical protein n=1 Tax=Saccharothrix deserti TaxID=2593674 RepID=UPI00131CCFE7|nr:hypothetical protein [Saccharothrix deserti]